jgi:hypothetical protein
MLYSRRDGWQFRLGCWNWTGRERCGLVFQFFTARGREARGWIMDRFNTDACDDITVLENGIRGRMVEDACMPPASNNVHA